MALLIGCRDRTPEFMAVAERLRSQARGRGRRMRRLCAWRKGLRARPRAFVGSPSRVSHTTDAARPPRAQLGTSAGASGSAGGGGAGGSSPLLPARGGASASPSGTLPPLAGAPTSQSDFSRRAARIGHGIHSTSAKLARLTQLARRTSVFDDPTQEINELTAIVKQDITALNSALTELQGQAARRGGSRDSSEHGVTVVDALKARLLGATKEFREVLTLRQDSIKAHHNRRQLFSAQPEGGGGGGGGASGAARRFGAALQTSGAGGLPTHTRSPGLGGAAGGAMALALAAPSQDTYLASRAEALAQVERTIAELGGIFSQLATMVAEQGELAVRIDEHMDDTVANVDSAQAHLLKYLARISSNRWLVMKVFAVLLLFMVFFVVFIA
jgi:syntaxin 5